MDGARTLLASPLPTQRAAGELLFEVVLSRLSGYLQTPAEASTKAETLALVENTLAELMREP